MIQQLFHKLRAQITILSRKLSQGVSKACCRFIDEMIYGLTSSQGLMFSEISRGLNELIPLNKIENRLCRNLRKYKLRLHLQRALAKEQSSHIKKESFFVLDMSDISKKHAQQMQYLGKVRDGSEGKISNWY